MFCGIIHKYRLDIASDRLIFESLLMRLEKFSLEQTIARGFSRLDRKVRRRFERMSDHKTKSNKIEIQEPLENAAPISNTQASTGEADQQPTDDAIKLLEAEQKAAETHDRFLRLAAEFENYKKRTARETADFRKFANEALLKELLLVVDNLERAIESARAEEGGIQSLLQGVEMTRNEILKVFDKFGTVPITAMGETFDPNFHQAVAQETSNDHPENTVVQELQKGYMLHDRLLRPSMVIVSKPGEKSGKSK